MQETLVFTGTARDYFRVWIVNLFLTIATLGLYSPWAKVRKKRYLHGHTWLAGSNFDYHGDPVAILRGRLIAFAAFVLYSVGGQFSQRAAATVLLVLMPAIPWLIVRSFAFNAANSSWRNLRFHYEGSYRDAAKAILPFVAIPVGTLVFPLDPGRAPAPRDIGLALMPSLVFLAFYPFVRARLSRLRLGGTRYGESAFACTVRARSFYGIYVLAMVIAFGVTLLFGIVSGVIGAVLIGVLHLGPSVAVFLMLFTYVVAAATTMAYTQSRTSNLVIGSTSLAADVRFRSTLSARRLARLYAGNVTAILLTLGLAIPWAVIRTLRYRAACLSLESERPLDHFTSRAAERVTATGEEMGDMFALDVSI